MGVSRSVKPPRLTAAQLGHQVREWHQIFGLIGNAKHVVLQAEGVTDVLVHQVISNTGFESPCSTKGESCRFSPLDTPSVMCPRQATGYPNNHTLARLLTHQGSASGLEEGVDDKIGLVPLSQETRNRHQEPSSLLSPLKTTLVHYYLHRHKLRTP